MARDFDYSKSYTLKELQDLISTHPDLAVVVNLLKKLVNELKQEGINRNNAPINHDKIKSKISIFFNSLPIIVRQQLLESGFFKSDMSVHSGVMNALIDSLPDEGS